MKPGTELPWSIRETYYQGEPASVIVHPNLHAHRIISETAQATAEDYADAAYIAHAANLYPELVEMVKQLAYTVTLLDHEKIYSTGEANQLGRARELLTRAETEEE